MSVEPGQPLAEFVLSLEPGAAGVIVNGIDVSAQVVGLGVAMAGAGEVPRLTLRVHSTGAIVGKGIVVVQEPVDAPADVGAAVVAFLEAMDPTELERKALSGLGMGSDVSAGAMIVRQLIIEAGGTPE